jgi:O-methyltransferase
MAKEKVRFFYTWPGKKVHRAVALVELATMKYFKSERVIDVIRQVLKSDADFMLSSDVYMIYSLAQRQVDIEGDYAEVGCYKGASAVAICEAKGDKPLHLFDTFEGLPEVETKDGQFSAGMYKGEYELVKSKIDNYPNVKMYKGLFPDTTGPVADHKFAFVNIDVDIYSSQKSCLEFFYPRLVKGGVLLSHDYSKGAPGVVKAFDEFMADKPERIIEMYSSQCLFIKE